MKCHDFCTSLYRYWPQNVQIRQALIKDYQNSVSWSQIYDSSLKDFKFLKEFKQQQPQNVMKMIILKEQSVVLMKTFESEILIVL